VKAGVDRQKESIERSIIAALSDPRSGFTAGLCAGLAGTLGTQLERMAQAAACFVGTHDFASFMASGSDVTDTVRTVTEAEIKRCGDSVVFRVAADGFLYNMVRIMTGTLIDVAEGKLSPEDIPSVLAARDRTRAGATAPPHGLYLCRVVYPKDI